MSEGGEHWELAREVAQTLKLKDGQLRQWARRLPKRYRLQFERCLYTHALNKPVWITAISAQGQTIENAFDHAATELGLSQLIKLVTTKKRESVRFGPFSKISHNYKSLDDLNSDTGLMSFELSKPQALYVLHLTHFILRMHQWLLSTLNENGHRVDWLDLQVSPDRFPNGAEGKMARLFSAILSGAKYRDIIRGNVRILQFENKNEDQGSLLADNVAGLLATKLAQDDQSFGIPELSTSKATFHWEIWNQK